MKQLWEITKVQLGMLVKKPKKSNVVTNALYYLSPLFFLGLSYIYADNLFNMLPRGVEGIGLIIFTIISTLIVFLNTIQSVKGYLMEFKDFDFLMALPVHRTKIMASKLISFLLFQIAIGLVVMIPVIGLYGIKTAQEISYYLIAIVGVIPMILVPCVLGTIVTILIQKLPAMQKYPELLNNLIMTATFFIVIYFSSATIRFDELSLREGWKLLNGIVYFAPGALMFARASLEINFLWLLGLITFSSLLLVGMVQLFAKDFISINLNRSKGVKNKNFKLKQEKQESRFFALFKKEVKSYFGNFLYVFNTFSFSIMYLIGFAVVVWLLITGDAMVSMLVSLMKTNAATKELFFVYFATALGSLGFMVNTANCSVSLEGKNLWILKIAPISDWQIFNAKVLLNALLNIIPLTIIVVGAGVILELDILKMMVALAIVVVNGFAVGYFGLAVNLMFPKLNFDRSIEVVKQSMSVFISIMVGIAVAMVQFFVVINVEFTNGVIGGLFILGLNVLYLIISLVYLEFKGRKKFLNL